MYCLLHCLFFVFDWGIRGAATATVCAQLIALVWQLHLFCRKDELIRLKKGIFRLKRKIVLDSLAIGMSPFLMNMASCFIVILINQGLKSMEVIWRSVHSVLLIVLFCLYYDCIGTKPRDAAHCGI